MIEHQKLELEFQKYHENKRQTKENTNSNDRLQGTLMQEKENWRNISPEAHDYDIPNFNITKGEKSKNKYEQRTMEMWNHTQQHTQDQRTTKASTESNRPGK